MKSKEQELINGIESVIKKLESAQNEVNNNEKNSEIYIRGRNMTTEMALSLLKDLVK